MLKRLGSLCRAPAVIFAALFLLAGGYFGSSRDFGWFLVSIPALALLLVCALVATVWTACLKGQRGRAAFVLGAARLRNQRRLDPVARQRFGDAPCAKSAPHHPRSTRHGEPGIIDITARHHRFDQPGHIGGHLVIPAALSDFPRKIGRKPAAAGGKPRDIGERKLVQSRSIERSRLLPGPVSALFIRLVHGCALFVPQSRI